MSTLFDDPREESLRRQLEFYATDPRDVREFLEIVKLTAAEVDPRLNRLLDPTRTILDPSAGGDDKHAMPYPLVWSEYGCSVTTMDLRESSPAEFTGNFLTDERVAARKWGGVGSNPPFKPHKKFIARAHDIVESDGFVTFLLPLRVMEPPVDGSRTRNKKLAARQRRKWLAHVGFWKRFRPDWIFTHPRLKFANATSTNPKNSAAFDHYGHMVWFPDSHNISWEGRPVDDAYPADPQPLLL